MKIFEVIYYSGESDTQGDTVVAKTSINALRCLFDTAGLSYNSDLEDVKEIREVLLSKAEEIKVDVSEDSEYNEDVIPLIDIYNECVAQNKEKYVATIYC